MADANGRDVATLTITDDEGVENKYNVSDMGDDARVLYAKIEMLVRDSMNRKAAAELALEQNSILQRHYLDQIRPLLEDAPIAENEGSSKEETINEENDTELAATATE